jgi:hypothetical protein
MRQYSIVFTWRFLQRKIRIGYSRRRCRELSSYVLFSGVTCSIQNYGNLASHLIPCMLLNNATYCVWCWKCKIFSSSQMLTGFVTSFQPIHDVSRNRAKKNSGKVVHLSSTLHNTLSSARTLLRNYVQLDKKILVVKPKVHYHIHNSVPIVFRRAVCLHFHTKLM